MRNKEVYSLTPLGEHQLRGAMTTALPAEVELLVRVDGILTLGQIKAGMKPFPPDDFDATFSRLIGKGLLHLQMDDPFADQFTIKPSKKALTLATTEADAGTASLQKAGYFVRIVGRAGIRVKMILKRKEN